MTSHPWVQFSFDDAGRMRNVYSAREASALIEAAALLPDMRITLFTAGGPVSMAAREHDVLLFPPAAEEEPEREPERAGGDEQGTDDTAPGDGGWAEPPSPGVGDGRVSAASAGLPLPATDAPRPGGVSAPTGLSRRPAPDPPGPEVANPFADKPLILLALYRYADFSGRSSRKEYWAFILFYILCITLYLVLSAALGEVLSIIMLLGLWVLIVPHVAVIVRRLHDQNFTGWLALLMVVPYLGWVGLLALMLLDGTPGPNRYGPPPAV